MRPLTLTNTKTKVFSKLHKRTRHPYGQRIQLMLATTIQLPNTTPHHQDGATTPPPTKGGPGVVSGPNSVPAASLSTKTICCCAPSPRPLQTIRLLTAHTPPMGMFFVVLLRKEVIQPHLPVRLPCYDFVPIADPTFDSSPHKG